MSRLSARSAPGYMMRRVNMEDTDVATQPQPGALLKSSRLRIEKYDLEVGPPGHLAAESARLAAQR